MANWANTSYCIEGNEKDLRELHETMKALAAGEIIPVADAADGWEGNVTKALGIESDNAYLRGFIQEYRLDGEVLKIEAQEAWSVTDFKDLLESHYENMKVYYLTEELGCQVYETNDSAGKYFDDKFLVDSYVDGDGEMEYFKTKEEALEYIAQRLGLDDVTEEQIETWNEEREDGDEFINIIELKVVD